MSSVGVILTFFDDLKTFLPLLAFAGNVLYQTQLNSASSLCLFLNYPKILCINPDISQRWCIEPVCRHSWCWCWCWWRCRFCVGFTLLFMSSHHCWWKMQSQSDNGCVDFEKNEELCSLSLVDTAISDQCANGLPWFEMITCHFSSSDFWYTEEFYMHIFWVIKNKENCLHSCNLSHVKYFLISENLILPPILFTNVFPGYRRLQYIQYFLVFWVISIFFTCKKSKFFHPGLQMNSYANFTYSFPQLKIILIPTMITSNCFSFITLIACTERYYCDVT